MAARERAPRVTRPMASIAHTATYLHHRPRRAAAADGVNQRPRPTPTPSPYQAEEIGKTLAMVFQGFELSAQPSVLGLQLVALGLHREEFAQLASFA